MSDEGLDTARASGEARLRGPGATAAHFDAGRNRVVVRLTTGVEIAFPPAYAEGLERARPADLDPIEITPAGLGVQFPKLDADLYVPALLEGVLGSERWMAALKRRIGRERSGRPRKKRGA